MGLSGVTPFLVAGAGKMGGAMLRRWLDLGLDPAGLTIADPNAAAADWPGIRVVPSLAEAPARPATVLLAVKPQTMPAVLPALKALAGPETLVLSIAAGIRIKTLQAALGALAIVRVMPNTPAMVGRGMSVAVGNEHVDAAGRRRVTALLDAVGTSAWLENEDDIDAVTAVSGSGPAYVFHLVEALAAAARAAGLSPELAALLARQTVTGAGELLHTSPDSPETLRVNVTSPGGTTAAALARLMADDGLTPLMTRAVAAAKARAVELGK